ncbi:Holliday junction branch migration protein RuvA [Paramagnetospirillum magneticum]|uniref:Holliday junction branch migration complex subunit RuvA n=1 Tax=Paramagnetospirillum magneticum (strain ATCC 700264 / AMB-1) TaxID=342108 RepID=RUVA_PARM1|nr:Holliday junction branch migration protein RuvA [Paramagnetospirillum magneticum]Q2W2A3.1 RecName: Full=Holliday junction branch migration complex subunit RuvA [Paramagnetospirillum magneticum AMB-1]BAE52022.1 Holliday junction resolvasome, DNA-binding subunit [Paramagnetospirillum magneticum AMB-1]
MIAKLKGLIDSLGDDWAVVDCNGVGYLVACSSKTLARLETGTAAALFVETQVREDAISLFGFLETGERDWFRLLTTVQGVGAKVALAILSVASPDQLLQIIAAQDKAGLTRANGVGPKLAVRILTELKDKAGKIALGGFSPGGIKDALSASAPLPAASGRMEDAVSALVNLGYKRLEAFQAVGETARELGDEADSSALIRAALKHLGKGLLG